MDLDIPFRGSGAIAAGLTTRRRLRGPGFRELGRDTYVLGEHEVVGVDGVGVTSPIQTALDLASRADHVEGVIAVDALAHEFGFHPDELLDHPVLRDNPRGRRRLVAVVADADARAESPPGTRTRLVLRGAAGIPEPIPQLVVCDDRGRFVGRVDFGWRELRTALEYQGDHHRVDKRQWRRDAVRSTELAAACWLVLPITAHDLFVDPRGSVHRVRAALARRGGPALTHAGVMLVSQRVPNAW